MRVEHHLMMEAEVERRLRNAQDCLLKPKARKRQGRILSRVAERARLYSNLDVVFLASRPGREHISAV